MKVLKFGGTSVANAENIGKVKDIISSVDDRAIVVVSALGGVTDSLLDCARKAKDSIPYTQELDDIKNRHFDVIESMVEESQQREVFTDFRSKFERLESILQGIQQLNEFSDKSVALISSLGEILSTHLISKVLQSNGINCKHADSRQIIKTDGNFLKAKVDFDITNANFQELIKGDEDVILMGGFIASDENEITTTLGRGGSDYTASIAAAAVEADELQIWTDVSGILSTDPRLVKQAKPLKEVSYEEAMELSHFGAKVIYPPTIIPAKEKQIPIWIKNTFAPEKHGTKIHGGEMSSPSSIKGISSIKDVSLVSVIGSGMVGIPGFSQRMFTALSSASVNAIMITQASSEHSITVAITAKDQNTALESLAYEFRNEIHEGGIEEIRIDEKMAIVSVVGNNMRKQVGLSGRIFSALGKNGINIISLAQGSTERNVSTVIEAGDLKKAINVLHETFFEDSITTVNLFVMGVGLVGSELLRQIKSQVDSLRETNRVSIKVVGIANSRKMLIDQEGIDLSNYSQLLNDSSTVSNHQQFVDTMKEMNLYNTVFVDNTASKDVAALYLQIVKESISIVCCNKIAAASPLGAYNALLETARKNQAEFYNETNVGASLPIIHTIKDMVSSGDKIQQIEAILSGSLSFIFNEYDGIRSFAEVVKQAQKEGYTEPDPRIDLSGLDVQRKILILARVSEYQLDLEDVSTVSFMPESVNEAKSVDDFLLALEKEEAFFKALYDKANANNNKLKVIATFDASTMKAKVELREVASDSPYYHLSGKDNIVLIYSNRYKEDPLSIIGAGAGAAVTASGVFGDILKATRS